MKTGDQVRHQLQAWQEILKQLEEQYNKLGQIDMLSSEGHNLLAEINEVKGTIKTLKWILS